MVRNVVADNSALVPLFLPDESGEYSLSLLGMVMNGAVMKMATLCQIEFGNVIATSVRRRRLTHAEAAFAHKKFSELPMEFVDYVTSATMPAIHDLAVRRDLSFYDALYLALAMDERAILATLDKPLKQAAIAEGVEVL